MNEWRTVASVTSDILTEPVSKVLVHVLSVDQVKSGGGRVHDSSTAAIKDDDDDDDDGWSDDDHRRHHDHSEQRHSDIGLAATIEYYDDTTIYKNPSIKTSQSKLVSPSTVDNGEQRAELFRSARESATHNAKGIDQAQPPPAMVVVGQKQCSTPSPPHSLFNSIRSARLQHASLSLSTVQCSEINDYKTTIVVDDAPPPPPIPTRPSLLGTDIDKSNTIIPRPSCSDNPVGSTGKRDTFQSATPKSTRHSYSSGSVRSLLTKKLNRKMIANGSATLETSHGLRKLLDLICGCLFVQLSSIQFDQ